MLLFLVTLSFLGSGYASSGSKQVLHLCVCVRVILLSTYCFFNSTYCCFLVVMVVSSPFLFPFIIMRPWWTALGLIALHLLPLPVRDNECLRQRRQDRSRDKKAFPLVLSSAYLLSRCAKDGEMLRESCSADIWVALAVERKVT